MRTLSNAILNMRQSSGWGKRNREQNSGEIRPLSQASSSTKNQTTKLL